MRRLRVLYVAANPLDTSRLRLDEEIHQIEDRLRGAPLSRSIEVSSAWAVRVDDLARTVRARSPGVVHFSGHGSSEGIILEGAGGRSQPVPGDALADLFRLEGRSVRCVVLNACYTEGQARAIAERVPFVVGTSSSIRDQDAVAFSGRFYESIANEDTLEKAFEAGGNEIALQGGRSDVHHRFAHERAEPGAMVLLRKRS